MAMALEAGAVELARELLQKALAVKDSKEALKICENFELQVSAAPARVVVRLPPPPEPPAASRQPCPSWHPADYLPGRARVRARRGWRLAWSLCRAMASALSLLRSMECRNSAHLVAGDRSKVRGVGAQLCAAGKLPRKQNCATFPERSCASKRWC